MYCKECGTKIDCDEAIFCPSCGYKIERPSDCDGQVVKNSCPDGYKFDEASGLYYISHDKLDSKTGQALKEVTWYNPKLNAYRTVDYPINKESTIVKSKRKKSGLIVGIITFVIVIALAFCTWYFKWYRIFTSSEDDNPSVNVTPILTQLLLPSATPIPTATPEPTNPLGRLYEDYIVINEKEYSTDETYLYLAYQNLTSNDVESLKYMKNLISLDLRNNQITDLSFLEGLPNLEELYLQNNPIEDISKIATLQNISSLFLQETNVTDITSLSYLDHLYALDISYTQVEDISPLIGVNSLEVLYIEEAPIKDYSVLCQLSNLYLCDVDYEISVTPELPLPQDEEGYEYTDLDYEYFYPCSDNYIIIYDEEIVPTYMMISYDNQGYILQILAKLDATGYYSEEEIAISSNLIAQNLGVSDITVLGTIIYAELPQDYMEESITKDSMLEYIAENSITIIENVP